MDVRLVSTINPRRIVRRYSEATNSQENRVCQKDRNGATSRPAKSGRSVAWLARVVRVHEVVSSNLTAPTTFLRKSGVFSKGFIFPNTFLTLFTVKAPRQFPVVVRTGSVGVKIYRADREKDGSEYTSYTLSCTAADGRRKLKAFAAYGEAYEEAKAVSLKLAQLSSMRFG